MSYLLLPVVLFAFFLVISCVFKCFHKFDPTSFLLPVVINNSERLQFLSELLLLNEMSSSVVKYHAVISLPFSRLIKN